MSLHFKFNEQNKRLILECGSERMEIFCNLRFIEFCPICGEKIDVQTKNH
jgi:hypothetical protein